MPTGVIVAQGYRNNQTPFWLYLKPNPQGGTHVLYFFVSKPTPLAGYIIGTGDSAKWT